MPSCQDIQTEVIARMFQLHHESDSDSYTYCCKHDKIRVSDRSVNPRAVTRPFKNIAIMTPISRLILQLSELSAYFKLDNVG